MDASTALDRGRTAFSEHRWADAVAGLDAADRATAATAPDLEQLATAAVLVGRFDESVAWRTRAHEAFLAGGDLDGAIRSASWLGMEFVYVGDLAQAGGWFARAQRLLHERPDAPADRGFLLIPEGLAALDDGDGERAAAAFARATELARAARDADLIALGELGRGQADIMLGRPADGLARLDEVMVAVTAGEVSPVPSGIVYCEVLQCCRQAFDVRRAHEWTRALDRWCAERPDMVAFSGQCHAHRSELFLLHGAWADALAAAQEASERAATGDPNGVFAAWYQIGEVHRLRGEVDAAASSFEEAGRTGFEPQPGLALLLSSQGDHARARAMILAAAERADPAEHRWLLPAMVEILLAAGDVVAARGVADELRELGRASPMPMLAAFIEQADGAVLIAEGDARAALAASRHAWARWRDLDVPYEAARCRVIAARACRKLGDEASASMELDAARVVFEELGARPALSAMEVGWSSAGTPSNPDGLTGREVEVLRLVAAGRTNRRIAEELYLSEKTVERHLSNIFGKLDLPSRSAATAYAFRHGLAD
ncbi:LuxR C-terminal-related transcriptional regulator [Agromyces binzhouensis]|uniref:LuxR C-terminal-related transcriptional regulator n=1 Tax=Agromyces binzhouensis TaxID=1817495 RepID=UPI003634EE0E